jgi:uncharacterized protein (TIGR02757 family)
VKNTTHPQLKKLLDQKYLLYNTPEFIKSDPIQVPHSYSKREDIEIAGFLTATIAWGIRKSIIGNSMKLMQWMDNAPYDFLMNATEEEYGIFLKFVHRTFSGEDCIYFLHSLKNIYTNHNGLQGVFENAFIDSGSIFTAIEKFREVFFELPHLTRTQKHVANVSTNASAKRLNMYLRWMVRHDEKGVDFGIWNTIPASALYIPLDVHSGNIARKLALLIRTQNDWKAVDELTSNLRLFDPDDPVKYDFALFGMGAFEKI